MAIYRIDWHRPQPAAYQRVTLAVGNFDGIHLGHIRLIRQLVDLSEKTKARPIVVTFDPPPSRILHKTYIPLLTPLTERAKLIRALGAEMVVLPTDEELLSLDADRFIRDILFDRLQAQGIVEGFNFRFGRNRTGDVELLRKYCNEAKIPFLVTEPALYLGEPISSTRLRQAVTDGDCETIQGLLGRTYQLIGRVEHGDGRGRTIGFPTANIGSIEMVIPGPGVYAALAHTEAATWHSAVNVGPAPTFGNEQPRIEAHLISFSGDLYGQMIKLEFIKKLRPIRKFPNAQALIEQIRLDIRESQDICREYSN